MHGKQYLPQLNVLPLSPALPAGPRTAFSGGKPSPGSGPGSGPPSATGPGAGGRKRPWEVKEDPNLEAIAAVIAGEWICVCACKQGGGMGGCRTPGPWLLLLLLVSKMAHGA